MLRLFFCGRAFGKHKMCPTISPKKTWEGSIGGTIVATIVGVCFGFFIVKYLVVVFFWRFPKWFFYLDC
ncbi:MAG: phosphatidate cytidylyltransferase [Clostridium sp.]|nr:MAG: phosphatidate cytidylyltransferase [Clostridium sp.]